jgi:hypothetical protein
MRTLAVGGFVSPFRLVVGDHMLAPQRRAVETHTSAHAFSNVLVGLLACTATVLGLHRHSPKSIARADVTRGEN